MNSREKFEELYSEVFGKDVAHLYDEDNDCYMRGGVDKAYSVFKASRKQLLKELSDNEPKTCNCHPQTCCHPWAR